MGEMASGQRFEPIKSHLKISWCLGTPQTLSKNGSYSNYFSIQPTMGKAKTKTIEVAVLSPGGMRIEKQVV